MREFVTLNRGTGGGGGLTSIGSDNLFMAYAHVAHDCRVGNHTIFANGATLAGHVDVADHATIGAFSAVHQFCRVGVYGFLGGYTVATKDVLPYSKTVGNRARIYGVNTLGLQRRGFAAGRDRRHPPRLSHPPAEPAQHQRGPGPAGGGADDPGGARCSSTSSARPARRGPASGPAADHVTDEA